MLLNKQTILCYLYSAKKKNNCAPVGSLEKNESPMWDLKAFEGQGLRARLCCRKISDSIFWLHCFTPRCLAQRKTQKKYTKRKDRNKDKRRKHFFYTFLYLLDEGTNQRYVPRRSVVPKTPESKIGFVGSTDTAWKRNIISSPFSRGKNPFFFLRMRHLLFR